MKKKICRLFALMLACTGLLTGCGEKMYELTEKEEEVIVQYAAYVLGKHNIYQKDGMVKLEPEEYRDTQEEDSQSEMPESEAQEGGNSEGQAQEVQSVALSAIAGQDGAVTFQYLGYETVKEYAEGEYFSLEAGEGKAFVLMHFVMKNDTEQDVNVNFMKTSPDFYCKINGDQVYAGEKSLANQDLSTFLGTLKGGEELEVVLLFEVPEGVSGSISELDLLFDQNGTQVPVIL